MPGSRSNSLLFHARPDLDLVGAEIQVSLALTIAFGYRQGAIHWHVYGRSPLTWPAKVDLELCKWIETGTIIVKGRTSCTIRKTAALAGLDLGLRLSGWFSMTPHGTQERAVGWDACAQDPNRHFQRRQCNGGIIRVYT